MPRPPRLSGNQAVGQVTQVIVGIVRDGDNRILIGRRPDGSHMAGYWEFPGGKIEPGETPQAALGRELEEELGIRVESAEPLLKLSHRYPDREVCLDVWWVLAWSGEVCALENQSLRWVEAPDLAQQSLLPADAPIVASICQQLASKAPAES